MQSIINLKLVILTQNMVLGTSPPQQRTSSDTRLSKQIWASVLRRTRKTFCWSRQAKHGKGEKAQLTRTIKQPERQQVPILKKHHQSRREATPGAERVLQAICCASRHRPVCRPSAEPRTTALLATALWGGHLCLQTLSWAQDHFTSSHGPTGRAPLSADPQLSPGLVSCLNRTTQ